jgi:hypothetical protein
VPISFPANPSVNDTFTSGNRTWQWTGSTWKVVTGTVPAGSVSTNDIADSAITTAKIAAGAVVEADIANNAVTAGKLGTDVQLGYRNVIMNGAMQVAQRGTSTASIATSGYYTADRWFLNMSGLGTWTQSVENDGPTGSGFRKSIKMLCTTADASPAASDFAIIEQRIEGQNVQQFLKGTSSARQFAVSFWVKSNVTGTFIFEFIDADNNRSVSASYAISSADTWEKKTFVFPADTSGAFSNDNGTSLRVFFWLGASSNWSSGTLQTEWGSRVSSNDAVGQTNLASATNNYWQVTGVQIEAGSVSTPFEFEDYGTTLAKCQRYYNRIAGDGVVTYSTFGAGYNDGANLIVVINFPTTMRIVPTTFATSAAGTFYLETPGGGVATTIVYTFRATTSTMQIVITKSGLTAGAGLLLADNVDAAYIAASADL